jgi:hypothetical protein
MKWKICRGKRSWPNPSLEEQSQHLPRGTEENPNVFQILVRITTAILCYIPTFVQCADLEKTIQL